MSAHRGAALRYFREGRLVVSFAAAREPGQLPHSATVRILPAIDGPERVVLLDGTTVTCSCGSPSATTAPGCGHVYAALQALGRGGPK